MTHHASHTLVAWFSSSILLFAAPTSQAHPYGDTYPGQHIALEITREGVGITYAAEIPHALLSGEDAPTAADIERMFVELSAGVTLSVDGQTLPRVEVSRTDRPDLVSTRTRILQLVWTVDVDLTGRHVLEVGNANLPMQVSYYRDDVSFPGSIWLHDSSLWVPRASGTPVDLSAAWTRSELRRRIRLDLTLPSDPWSVTFDQIDAQSVTHADAQPRAFSAAWARGRRTPATVALALGLAWLGGVSQACSGALRKPQWLLAVAGASAAWLLFLAPSAWSGAMSGAIGAIFLVWPVTRAVGSMSTALPALALTGPSWLAWTLAAWLLGGLMTRPLVPEDGPPRHGRAAILLGLISAVALLFGRSIGA